MKTNGTLITRKLWLTAFVLLLMVTFTKAQTSGADFSFTTHSLISGTALQPGATYLFTNVRAGIDCRVTILSISAGISIATFDDNAAGSGYVEAFQPRINANAKTKGYVEFRFRFVRAGTNMDTVVGLIPASSIDVDGSLSGADSLVEFDEYLLPSAYSADYDMLAGKLYFIYQSGSITGRYKDAIDFPGIDTSAKQVMFTVMYPSTSTFTVRIGTDNNWTSSAVRRRSVYFKRFAYPNSFLPAKPLRLFAGAINMNSVRLNWSMNRGHNIISADVERSLNGISFTKVGTVAMASENSGSYGENAAAANSWYRIKMTDFSGKISYSEVLMIKNGASQQGFKVFPSVINDYTTVNFSAAKAGSASLSIADNNGRFVKRQTIPVQQGFNTAMLNSLDQVPAGQYVMVVNGAGYSYTQKILIVK